MNTQTLTNATNDLRHSITATDHDGNPMYIKIELNDDCKNGHQDFSITCDIYQKGKPKTDKYFIMGGCCHDEILKVRPDLKIFVNLHLCDYKGIPMHPTANMRYHLREGFNNSKPGSIKFLREYCEYYRITPTQFNELVHCHNDIQMALKLQELGILAQWEAEANEAIKILEDMTGKSFLVDSKRTQLVWPTPEQLKEEEEKQSSGYYTPEAIQQREEDKKRAELTKLIDERENKIKAITEEYAVKTQVLVIGGKAALDNCIYYNHTRTIAFNGKFLNESLGIFKEDYVKMYSNGVPTKAAIFTNDIESVLLMPLMIGDRW